MWGGSRTSNIAVLILFVNEESPVYRSLQSHVSQSHTPFPEHIRGSSGALHFLSEHSQVSPGSPIIFGSPSLQGSQSHFPQLHIPHPPHNLPYLSRSHAVLSQI